MALMVLLRKSQSSVMLLVVSRREPSPFSAISLASTLMLIPSSVTPELLTLVLSVIS
ncbi:hypothetical protein CLU79DRAFT_735458 [Phycomyces nitens]|nr:hypothetical protein CLU79DRAFT_735458 [Phycomyces nitens]